MGKPDKISYKSAAYIYEISDIYSKFEKREPIKASRNVEKINVL
jgi:hypothetical protein